MKNIARIPHIIKTLNSHPNIFETHRNRKEIKLISLRIQIARSHGGGWEASPETKDSPGGDRTVKDTRREVKDFRREAEFEGDTEMENGERKRLCVFEEIINIIFWFI